MFLVRLFALSNTELGHYSFLDVIEVHVFRFSLAIHVVSIRLVMSLNTKQHRIILNFATSVECKQLKLDIFVCLTYFNSIGLFSYSKSAQFFNELNKSDLLNKRISLGQT